MDITKIKLSTLNRIIEPLEQNKLIEEACTGQSTGGRKPALFGINTKSIYFIGIDISRTYTEVVITDLGMKVAYRQSIPMNASSTPIVVLKHIEACVQAGLNHLPINKGMVAGVGISAVGPIDRSTGILLNPRSFTAPGWANIPIKIMVEEKLGLPAVIDNGANMAALAEYTFGEGKGFKSVAYINCGIGIRTGSISQGTLVRTLNDAEDAFGHMVINIDGELCSCGNYGCIESYSSLLAIASKFCAGLKKGRSSILHKPLEQITFIDICSAAESNDEFAREIISDAATTFGAGLANYINLMNPELIVLSGPLIKFSGLFYEVSTNTALKRVFHSNKSKTLFSKGGCFKEDAMAVGAAVAVLESILK